MENVGLLFSWDSNSINSFDLCGESAADVLLSSFIALIELLGVVLHMYIVQGLSKTLSRIWLPPL